MAFSTRRRVAAVLLASSLALAACSSDAESGDTTEASSGDATTSAEQTSDAPVEAGDDTRTSVEGEFGTSATMTFEDGDPAEGLQVEVVSEGDGDPVGADDAVLAHYVGQVWQGEVFDSSYPTGAPRLFSLNGVIKAWKDGLTGVPVGSRVIISVPPELGYGEQGNPQAGIEGTDTIVFTIDVIDSFAPDATGQADASPTDADIPVTYDGDLGEPVSNVQVAEGTEEPTEAQTIVIAEGTGEPVPAGDAGSTAILQYAAATWDGSVQESTWDYAQPVATPIQGSFFEGLGGVPVGSRVLVLVPGQTNPQTGEDQPGLAAVVDVIGQIQAQPAQAPAEPGAEQTEGQ